MAEIEKCDICGVVPELRTYYSIRMISHRCKDFYSGWHNRTKVVEDWNNSNSQKIEEAASSTSTNNESLKCLSDCEYYDCQTHCGWCLRHKENSEYDDFYAKK